MNFFVYGFLPSNKVLKEAQMLALVGAYKTRVEAEIKRDTENLCWSDEGLIFRVKPFQLVATHSYDELVKRVMK